MCICVCVHVCMCVCMCVYMCVCMCACTRVCVCMCVCVYACMRVCVYVCVYVCVCVRCGSLSVFCMDNVAARLQFAWLSVKIQVTFLIVFFAKSHPKDSKIDCGKESREPDG